MTCTRVIPRRGRPDESEYKMFWDHPTDIPPAPPTTVSEAIEMFEMAIHEVMEGLRKADELNAKETRPVNREEEHPHLEIRLTEPPEPSENPILPNPRWQGEGFNQVLHMAVPYRRPCKPQTLFERFSHVGTWQPNFHMKVNWGISMAVQFLGPICERAGWSTDPFDRLIAIGVDTNPICNKGYLQEALLLVAKLRRSHGLPGAGFHGLPKKAKSRRGAPIQHDPRKDAKIYDAWKSERYRTFADCANVLGGEHTAESVKLAVDRHEKRLQNQAVKPR